MSKFIAKFRKDRDYKDDYETYSHRKKSKSHIPNKKLANYEYDNYFVEYDDDEEEYSDYTKNSRRKTNNY